jgi:hypothetical protein
MVTRVLKRRPFIPSKDCSMGRAFCKSLGFNVKGIGQDVAEDRFGACEVLAQDYFAEGWAATVMIEAEVDDLDASGSRTRGPSHAVSCAAAGEPHAMRPWGLRVACPVDPADAFWRFTNEH